MTASLAMDTPHGPRSTNILDGQLQLKKALELVVDPSVSASRRKELEAWLEQHSVLYCQNASQLVQCLDVANDPGDSQLYWYYISCCERHAGRLFWQVDSVARTKLLNDVGSLLNSCLHISSSLTSKVFSLHTTVLCWGASEQNETATAALLELCAPHSDTYQAHQAQEWQLKLERCMVLMDDLQSGLLRPDACSAGVLPAACLATLRGLFFSQLQKRICTLGLLAVKGATAEAKAPQHAQHGTPQASARNLLLGLDLLGKVLPTVASAGTLPVTAVDLVEVCIPHLSSAVEEEAEAALRAVHSICGLPMVPSERSALQKRLLSLLVSSSELAQRPLMRARTARAVLEYSGINLLKLERETCSMMHGLLVGVAEEARQRHSAQEVLCCLELWMLWLSRYEDLEDSCLRLDPAEDAQDLGIPAFRSTASTLTRTLLRCLAPMQELSGAPAMAVSAGALQLEAYSGAAMEEELAQLSIAETATAADLESSAHMPGTAAAPMSTQLSEDLCSALSAHSTSEHGVFCACIENVVARAVGLSGVVSAVEVWGCAAAALRLQGGRVLSTEGLNGAALERERAALDIHVLARLATRCTHELRTCDAGLVLGFAFPMVDWVTLAMQQIAGEGARAAQWPAMIAVGACFKALSALASLWVPEALDPEKKAPDAAAVTQTLAFLSSLFELSTSTIHCVLITLPSSASNQASPQAAQAGSSQGPLSEEAQHLACCASEALLATSHIAICSTHLTQQDAVALRQSSAARTLTEVCMHLALSPNAPTPGSLPERVQRDAWLAFSDMFAAWPARVSGLPEAQWMAVASDLRAALSPLLSAWADVHALVSTGASHAGGVSGQREQTVAACQRLCVCLASLLRCVRYLPKPARSCLYSVVEPAIEGALDVLEVAHCSGAHEMGLEGSRLMVAVVHSVLNEMPVALVKRMLAVVATAPQGSNALQAQQQVVRLVWCVTDEASSSVAALLPQAMSFLLTTLDGYTLDQLAASAPLATCARQCLCGIMHMLAHRYQAMVTVDASVKAAPCVAAQRFASYLEAAAAGNVASLQPQDLRELLEEFFDMQRVTGLYKREEFKQVRMTLEKGLMTMLLNPIADGAKEPLLDVLWGVGSTDWGEFVGSFLVQFCSICSELVQQRAEALVRPFTDQSGSLHDFPHFSACMDSLLNDLRFFEKLAAAGAATGKEE